MSAAAAFMRHSDNKAWAVAKIQKQKDGGWWLEGNFQICLHI